MTHASELLVTGDYYVGSSGPHIILFLHSPRAVEWLDSLFRSAAEGSAPFDLAQDPRAQITGLSGLRLRTRDQGPSIVVQRVQQERLPTVEWSATRDGWLMCSALIEPFLEGKRGHQYFDYEGTHEAVIEVSFEEKQGP